MTSRFWEGVGDVVGVEAPLGGVAQVIVHGVQVVEVGVQVRVHQDRGVEEDGERQVEGRKGKRTTHVQHGVKMKDSMNLSQEDHDTSLERQEGRLTKAAVLICAVRAHRDRSCHCGWCTWCHDYCPHWS